jgi:hypothetical protein
MEVDQGPNWGCSAKEEEEEETWKYNPKEFLEP